MQKEHYFLIISGILSGLIVFGGKIFANLGFSLFELSFLPLVFVLPILLPFVIFKKESGFKKKFLGIWIIYAMVTVCTLLGQFGAILLGVSVAMVVLLLYTQPLWTVLYSKIFLKERITKHIVIACALVLLGVLVIVNPFQSNIIINWLGIVVALFGGISLSGWVIVGSMISKRKGDPMASTFFKILFILMILAIIFPLASIFTKNPTITSFTFKWPLIVWLGLFGYALFIQALNHILFLKGVKKISASVAGIILLLEPISAAIFAAIFLNETITINIVIGGILILAGNYLVITKKD